MKDGETGSKYFQFKNFLSKNINLFKIILVCTLDIESDWAKNLAKVSKLSEAEVCSYEGKRSVLCVPIEIQAKELRFQSDA